MIRLTHLLLVCCILPNECFSAPRCYEHATSDLERGIVHTESSGNPFAIGVVNGRLLRQPHSLEEAIATAISLEISGFDYSVGCRQVNRKNFSAYRLSLANAFDPKANSEVGSQIYRECLTRANRRFGTSGAAIRAALSCYYSGNFTTGQRKEGNQPSYVDKVLANMRPGQQSAEALAIPIIPRKSGVVARHQLSHDHSVPVPRPEAKKKKAEWDAFDEL